MQALFFHPPPPPLFWIIFCISFTSLFPALGYFLFWSQQVLFLAELGESCTPWTESETEAGGNGKEWPVLIYLFFTEQKFQPKDWEYVYSQAEWY